MQADESCEKRLVDQAILWFSEKIWPRAIHVSKNLKTWSIPAYPGSDSFWSPRFWLLKQLQTLILTEFTKPKAHQSISQPSGLMSPECSLRAIWCYLHHFASQASFGTRILALQALTKFKSHVTRIKGQANPTCLQCSSTQSAGAYFWAQLQLAQWKVPVAFFQSGRSGVSLIGRSPAFASMSQFKQRNQQPAEIKTQPCAYCLFVCLSLSLLLFLCACACFIQSLWKSSKARENSSMRNCIQTFKILLPKASLRASTGAHASVLRCRNGKTLHEKSKFQKACLESLWFFWFKETLWLRRQY